MPGNLIPSGLGSTDHSCPNNHKKPCGTTMTYSDNGVMVYVYVFQYYKYHNLHTANTTHVFIAINQQESL